MIKHPTKLVIGKVSRICFLSKWLYDGMINRCRIKRHAFHANTKLFMNEIKCNEKKIKNENSGWVSVPPHTPDAQSTKARVYPVSVFLVCRRRTTLLWLLYVDIAYHKLSIIHFSCICIVPTIRSRRVAAVVVVLLCFLVHSQRLHAVYAKCKQTFLTHTTHSIRIFCIYSAYNVGQPMFLSLFVTIMCSMRKVIFIRRILAVHRYWYLSSICCILH